MNRFNILLARTLALLLLGSLLTGCGQKGPLYHPPAQSEADQGQ